MIFCEPVLIQCSLDTELNGVQVQEAGTVLTKASLSCIRARWISLRQVWDDPETVVEGRLVYDGMWAVLASDSPLHNVSLYQVYSLEQTS